MKKRPDREASVRVALRLPDSLLQRVDRVAERMRAEQPGVTVNRSVVVRLLLAGAIDRTEPGKTRRKTGRR